MTDVLAFRYDGEPIVGEVLVAPAVALTYARQHRLAYAEELARYVVHGLLHWAGYEDRTMKQQRWMRAQEDRLLAYCVDRQVRGRGRRARALRPAARSPR